MSKSPHKDGRRSFERGYSHNPYTSTVNRDEWQRGYDEAKHELDLRLAHEAALLDRWSGLPESSRLFAELEETLGYDTAAKVRSLVEAMIEEAKAAA